MCPVWYDEYSLRVGASLRESIERGLKETKNCIIVLSPNFLSNEGWGKAEFDSVFTREILQKQNVMLPVWHKVTVEQVYEYSPRLADKVGLNSNIGVKELARKLSKEIKVVKGAIKVAESNGEDIILMALLILTRDDVLECANELGMSEEQISEDVLKLVKKKVRQDLRGWHEIVKGMVKEAIKCPLGLICSPACPWQKAGECMLSRKPE